MSNRSVLIINTGGTLNMKPSEDGSLSPVKGYLSDQIKYLKEFGSKSMPQITLIDSDMGPKEWQKIAHAIERNYYDYDGFVILMGTDTMTFAATALSFMLENLAKPVIFTGSMVPLYEVTNDAQRNLVTSVLIAGTLDIPEVAIFFNTSLLRANRSIKQSAVSLDAFVSPNYPALADLGVGMAVRREYILPQPKRRFCVSYGLETQISHLRMVPGFDDQVLELVVAQPGSVKALILELYGTGNAPSAKSSFLECIRVAVHERGILVVATTQCAIGSDQYAVASALVKLGVVSALDMTPSATAMKLSYLFGLGLPTEEVSRLFKTNLRGELSAVERYQKIRTVELARL